MTCLIIAEKPAAAAKIGTALDARGRPVEVKLAGNKSYLEITLFDSSEKAVIVTAAGHLFGLVRDKKKKGLPIFDFKWELIAGNKHSARYVGSIEAVTRGRLFDRYVVATDYDTEGSVIGYNLLRFSCLPRPGTLAVVLARARRMRFSSLTPADLRASWQNMNRSLDCARVEAGCTRHRVDIMFGINMSAAITNSVKAAGKGFHVFSIGRVQGPTLKQVCERDKSIETHVPEPYWDMRVVARHALVGRDIVLESIPPTFKTEAEALALKQACEGKPAVVSSIRPLQRTMKPPPPFNLAGLQREANRLFKFKPSRTLKLAEKLYLDALISYPRTDSEVIPPSIDLKALLVAVEGDPSYRADARAVLQNGDLVPSKGTRIDEAHPPILPTGVDRKGMVLSKDEQALLDLVTRRFLALFGPDLTWVERVHEIIAGCHPFTFTTRQLLVVGWAARYTYHQTTGLNDDAGLHVGQQLAIGSVDVIEKHTNPPPHHSEITLMGHMERKKIGTKSTRAEIIEKIKARGYIEADPLRATPLGKKVVEVFETFLPAIVSETMTRELEDDMDQILEGKQHEDVILDKTRRIIEDMLVQFKAKESTIGSELGQLLDATPPSTTQRLILGKCPSCGKHDLALVRPRGKRRFVACEGHADNSCKVSLPVIQGGRVFPANKTCPDCGYPMVKCILKGKKPWEFCVNWSRHARP